MFSSFHFIFQYPNITPIIVYWGYIGIMENKMEATVFYSKDKNNVLNLRPWSSCNQSSTPITCKLSGTRCHPSRGVLKSLGSVNTAFPPPPPPFCAKSQSNYMRGVGKSTVSNGLSLHASDAAQAMDVRIMRAIVSLLIT